MAGEMPYLLRRKFLMWLIRNVAIFRVVTQRPMIEMEKRESFRVNERPRDKLVFNEMCVSIKKTLESRLETDIINTWQYLSVGSVYGETVLGFMSYHYLYFHNI